jgi:tubulin polyglutamylase TTLL6/13
LKFDLRIYALITSVDPLKLFLFKEGLVRFASQPYQIPKKSNLSNLFMHLTNYSINKDSPTYIPNTVIGDDDKSHKRMLTQLFKILKE